MFDQTDKLQTSRFGCAPCPANRWCQVHRPIKQNRRSAARLSASVRRRAVFGLTGARQWAAGKPVSGAPACAADRTNSVPFVWSLCQSIVRATNRKAGCGKTARPVWMGRDVDTRFLSISLKSEEEIRASSRRLLRVKETIHQLRGDLDVLSPFLNRGSHW